MSSEDISSPSAPVASEMTASPVFAWATRLLEPQYLLVVSTALGIIWLGAHGSLRRPPSAAPPKLKKGQKKREEEKFIEGLVASDVIRFPLMLAAFLMGLYYLIQWLQDPAIVNKILRGYMSIMSVAGLAAFAGDALDNLTSLVFPTMWASGRRIHYIDPLRRCQYVIYWPTREERPEEGKETPLPGRFSSLALSPTKRWFLWEVRQLLTEEWTVRLSVCGKALVKVDLRAYDFLRFIVAGVVFAAYHFTGWDALSNLLGLAMCYFSFMSFSPTSFPIGTMVLASLFVYDVVMVFYTPYMITVAKNIDAPIKLVFTSATGASMLGLGDIVVPGILMALALRFDQYMYYKRQGKLKTIWIERGTHLISRQIRIKARYVDPRGQWGNRFWTTPAGLFFFFYAPVEEAEEPAAATAFPKPYFYASVWGYTVGMFATLTAMLVFNHGQPALLYLVPCVTGALWLTGLGRGEFWDMWEYTEDGSLDTEDLIVEVDTEGKVIKEDEGEKEEEEGEEKDPEPKKPRDGFHELFLFSVTAPRAVASVS